MDAQSRLFLAVTTGSILIATLLPHVFGHNQNPRYLLGALPVLSLFIAAGAGIRLALLMSGVSLGQALIMLTFLSFGPYSAGPSSVGNKVGLAAVSWRSDATCSFTQVVKAASAETARPIVKFYGITDAINHVQIEHAFVKAGVLADVIPADLSRESTKRPIDTDADMILVLDPAQRRWAHAFVADPDADLKPIREELARDPAYVRSPAQVVGPAAECSMTTFVLDRSKSSSRLVRTGKRAQPDQVAGRS